MSVLKVVAGYKAIDDMQKKSLKDFLAGKGLSGQSLNIAYEYFSAVLNLTHENIQNETKGNITMLSSEELLEFCDGMYGAFKFPEGDRKLSNEEALQGAITLLIFGRGLNRPQIRMQIEMAEGLYGLIDFNLLKGKYKGTVSVEERLMALPSIARDICELAEQHDALLYW